MYKKLITLFFAFASTGAFAQIPNYPKTCGADTTNGYTSLSFPPGTNNIETYSTLQYGIGKHLAAGIELCTAPEETYWGPSFRYGNQFNKWFGLGLQATPSFNLNDNFHFAYFTGAIYLLGAISSDENLFWCSNTWLGLNKEEDNTYTNYEYLGYNFSFNDEKTLTPMLGIGHSWLFDEEIDLMGGLYYTYKDWTFYLWGNDFLKNHPRLTLAIEFFL